MADDNTMAVALPPIGDQANGLVGDIMESRQRSWGRSDFYSGCPRF
jgi:hypothetical protein